MKIYVVTHKPVDYPLPENYEYFQVNAKNNPVFCALNDAVGKDEISEKNPNYCELTAAYWIWKNDVQNDIVGLMHYRRFLTTNRFSSSPKKYLKADKIERLLDKYDFVSTKLYVAPTTVKEHLQVSVREKDLNLLRGVIARLYPDYLPVYDGVLAGKKSYLLNIFICKKKLWNEYYSWLFSIFGELEKEVDMTGYSTQEQRLYGYLSERLFTVYVAKNGYKVKSYPTHTVGISKWSMFIDKIKHILHLKR